MAMGGVCGEMRLTMLSDLTPKKHKGNLPISWTLLSWRIAKIFGTLPPLSSGSVEEGVPPLPPLRSNTDAGLALIRGVARPFLQQFTICPCIQ